MRVDGGYLIIFQEAVPSPSGNPWENVPPPSRVPPKGVTNPGYPHLPVPLSFLSRDTKPKDLYPWIWGWIQTHIHTHTCGKVSVPISIWIWIWRVWIWVAKIYPYPYPSSSLQGAYSNTGCILFKLNPISLQIVSVGPTTLQVVIEASPLN